MSYDSTPNMARIAITGLTGSGKTTLSQQLARRYDLGHIELDALYWDANWTPAPPDLFRARVRTALASTPCWVADGNYRVARDIIWGQADTIIWLDYPLSRLLWRLGTRSWRRIVRGTELWNGNREVFLRLLCDRDSLFRYVITHYARKKQEFTELFEQRPYPQATYLRFTTIAETERWVRSGMVEKAAARTSVM